MAQPIARTAGPLHRETRALTELGEHGRAAESAAAPAGENTENLSRDAPPSPFG
jgi:hypothetical protein